MVERLYPRRNVCAVLPSIILSPTLTICPLLCLSPPTHMLLGVWLSSHGPVFPAIRYDGNTFIAMPQLLDLAVKRHRVRATSAAEAFRAVRSAKTRSATRMELRFFAAKGAIAQKTSRCYVCLLEDAAAFCEELGLPNSLSHAFRHPMEAMQHSSLAQTDTPSNLDNCPSLQHHLTAAAADATAAGAVPGGTSGSDEAKQAEIQPSLPVSIPESRWV